MINNFLRGSLPYCLKTLPDGSWVVLNRDYKPLGFWTETWVKYEAHPISFRFHKRLSAAQVRKIAWKTLDEEGTQYLFLYDDGCEPTDSAKNMGAYLKRLRTLSALRVKHHTLSKLRVA